MRTDAWRKDEEGREASAAAVATDIETFAAPWPVVLAEMKDFIDLWFLARSAKRQTAGLRIFISKALVAQAAWAVPVRDPAGVPRALWLTMPATINAASSCGISIGTGSASRN